MVPVFIEFTSRHSNGPPTRHYFVGRFKTILQDTNNGMRFGPDVSYKILPEKAMRQLKVMAIDRSIKMVKAGKGSVCLHTSSSHVVMQGTPYSLRNAAVKLFG